MDKQFLDRCKSELVAMRARLIPTVQNVERSIVESVRSPGDISNAPTHLATADDQGVDDNITFAENEEGLLEEVEIALERIENGSYGQCNSCGRDIGSERLDAVPYTHLCIQCASRQNQNPTR